MELFENNFASLMPLFQKATIEKIYNTNAEAKETYDNFNRFIEEYKSILPNLEELAKLELTENIIKIPLILAALQILYNRIFKETALKLRLLTEQRFVKGKTEEVH